LRYAFIAEGQTIWPVSVFCEVMQVSRSGLYAYARRQAHRTIDGAKLALLARVHAMARETRQRDGSRRMATQLQAEGLSVGRSTARRLRQAAGVAVRRPRARGPVTTDSRHGDGVADNVLARQCDVAKPDHAWAGDSTYIWTDEGWVSLSVRLDVYARKGVGWAMRSHIDGVLVPHA
jgi:putative transposase